MNECMAMADELFVFNWAHWRIHREPSPHTNWHTEASCEGDDVLHAFTFPAISSSGPRYSSFTHSLLLSLSQFMSSVTTFLILSPFHPFFSLDSYSLFSCVSRTPSFHPSSSLLISTLSDFVYNASDPVAFVSYPFSSFLHSSSSVFSCFLCGEGEGKRKRPCRVFLCSRHG